jgi:DNA-binding response OmpR family regulator
MVIKMEKIELHIIDDDIGIYDLLKDFFEETPFELTASEEPQQGINYVKNHNVELVILDLMMPGMDGFEVCKKLREYNQDIPIIMLTAKKSEFDRIVGLELGADDYLLKPFNPRELLARVKTILRRLERNNRLTEINEKSPREEFRKTIYSQTWNIKLDIDSRRVTRNERTIDLTSTEFDLLRSLMENAGIVQSRDALLDKIRGIDFTSFDRTIDVFISRIRQKIGDNTRDPEIIKTVRSIGYLFPVL